MCRLKTGLRLRGRKRPTEEDLAKQIGKDVGLNWSFLKTFLCSSYGKDQVKDDNKMLRKKGQRPKNLACEGLEVREKSSG